MASSRDIIRILEKSTFVIKSPKGSHVKLLKDSKSVIVPHPKHDIPIGTFLSIIKQSGLDKKDFMH